MKKLISFGLILAIIFLPGTFLTSIKNGARGLGEGITKTNYTVLLCGYDEAAYNTDSIILLNYDRDINSVTFMQIPRDTYFKFSDGQNKINQYIPTRVSKGVSLADAMEEFSQELESAIGIHIDSYAGYTMRSIANIVDALGGIEINIPVPITGIDINGRTVKLNVGYNHLSGAESIVFLRFRQGYALGDLTRMDAQKIFISAFVNKLKSSVNAKSIIQLLTNKADGIITNINSIELSGFYLKNKGRINQAGVLFANLPGEHIMGDNSLSYFCINKYASSELIVHLPLKRISSFDINEKFLNSAVKSFVDLYYKTDVKYKIYTQNDLSQIKFY